MVSPGTTGGPVGTACCGTVRRRGWPVPGWITGAGPAPDRPGDITGRRPEVTSVKSTMAVTITALEAANPAGCVRAAARTDLEVSCMT